jgi:P27 family predicted phage terminase small subunit
LDVEAKRQWRKLAPELHVMGVLTKIDGNLLARYCQVWSRWRKMEEWVQKHGEAVPIKSETGRIMGYKRNPQVDIAARLLEIMTRLEPELGMTPSGRSRLEVGSEPEKPSAMKELILGSSCKKSG